MTQSVSPLGLPIGDRVVDWTPPQPPSRASLDGRYCRLEPVDPKRHGSDLYQANATDTEGRIFYERKLEEGKTKKEAIRALKRRLSDVVYRHLRTDQQPR